MSTNYKKISKNAMFLFFRMFLIMGVSFYTIRIVLNTLGVTDFGIYNLVASFVMIIAVLNNTLASGTQRFLTFEIGKNDLIKLRQTFSSSLLVHIVLAIIILVFGETIGLWFLYSKMNIPVDRVDAAFWTYQFSLFSVMVTITQVPYNALIIAHEKMNIFAYISILEAFLKLIIVYFLLIVSYDKLILYAILMFIVSIIIAMSYRIYTIKNYTESHFEFIFDKEILKPMINFSAWNLFGTIGSLASTQGISILLNIFFGPIANAAHAIAMQVNGALNQFVNNFQQAMTPTITKLYANNKIDELNNFLNLNVKYAFLVLWIIVLPIFLNLKFLLIFWLTEIPTYTMVFTQLLIIYGLLYILLRPLAMAIHATGKNKGIQLSAGTLLILLLPISYLLLENGLSIYSPLILSILVWFIHISLELYFLKKYINFSTISFLRNAICPIIFIVTLSSLPMLYLLPYLNTGFAHFLLFSIFSFFLNSFLIYNIGLESSHKEKVKSYIFKKYKNEKATL